MKDRPAQEYGEWLSGYGWTHWITLTVDPSGRKRMGRAGKCPRSPEGVRRAFRNEFVRYAEKVSGRRVPFAYAVERGIGGDNPHVHALLWVYGGMESALLVRAWRHGRATVEAYDPARGAVFYLSKTFGRDGAEWDVSSTFPPAACSEATGRRMNR
jgi:hypothetical protein